MLRTSLRYLLLTIVFFGLFIVPSAYVSAREATDSATKQEKIELIKGKVASKVAELTKAITVGMEGTIERIEEGILTLDVNGKQKTVNTDDETVISKQNKDLSINKLKFDNLEENDEVVVIGEEQIGTDIINAKLVATAPKIIAFVGEVKEVDSRKFTFILVESEEEYTFDFEKYTDSVGLSGNEFKEVGFSKIEEGAKVQLIASPQKNSETRFTALRIIAL